MPRNAIMEYLFSKKQGRIGDKPLTLTQHNKCYMNSPCEFETRHEQKMSVNGGRFLSEASC